MRGRFFRFFGRFRRTEPEAEPTPEPLPYEPDPLDAAFEYADDILFDEQRLKGEHFRQQVTTSDQSLVYHYMDYAGNDPRGLYVEPGKMLHGEYVLITPEGRVYKVYATFPSGEQYSLERELDILASSLKNQHPEIEKPSGTVQSAMIQANYYIRYYFGA